MHQFIRARFEAATLFKPHNRGKKSAHWEYTVIPESFYHADLGEYHTYGIHVSGPDCMETIHDVSPCKETADQIAECFTFHQLSPIHFWDAIEDMLP